MDKESVIEKLRELADGLENKTAQLASVKANLGSKEHEEFGVIVIWLNQLKEE